MPELPEVETIRKKLIRPLPLQIIEVEESPFISSIIKKRDFDLSKKIIKSIERIGKVLNFILFDPSSEETFHIISQLGMSGGWRISNKKITEKHTHLQLTCVSTKNSNKQATNKYTYLAYVDPRRFGKMILANNKNAKIKLSSLGVDISGPLFTEEYIFKTLQQFPDREIKPFLLEQKFFAGIGNYIASEICARAKILPTRKNESISKSDAKKIKQAAKEVIEGSLKTQGLSFHGGYVDADGNKGEGLNNLVVFWQKTCGMCKKNKVTKITQKGRGTYFCDKCQK